MEQVSLSDYGATPQDKVTFYFLVLRPKCRWCCRSSVYSSRTQETLTEKVAVPVCLLGNTNSAYRVGLGTRSRNVLHNAFTCFTSRCGVPKEVASGRGTNFVGVVGELKKLISQLERQELDRNTAELGATCRFNPPAAPHFRATHEVMVKAAKKATCTRPRP